MNTSLILLTLLTGISGPGPESQSPHVYRTQDCLISWLRETDVPAQTAGVINQLDVIEGTLVTNGGRLAQVDDSKARMSQAVATAIFNEAKEKAENDVNIRFAKAAAAVAETEYEQAVSANKQRAGVVPELEIRRLQLSLRRANLAVEQAMTDQRILGFSLEAKQQEVNTSEAETARHMISAMSDGMVVEVYRHPGEWVQPGDPVMRIAPMDRLRVETLLRSAELGASEVAGKPVRVIAHLERGRTAEFHGKITHVHPQIYAGEYRVWAEVDNRMENGQWLLRPGADADLEIDVSATATSARVAEPPEAGATRSLDGGVNQARVDQVPHLQSRDAQVQTGQIRNPFRQ
ncbi:MAG: HlyD family efflux transporter periplasmic adaptor subunit [Pirellulales bacterium]|nr:HlyD family efflux transporter periplasmic adaptor subunit [Pirellulales bacterium]